MLSLVQKFVEAMDYIMDNEVFVFYSDFSKAFDRVPHYELLKNH